MSASPVFAGINVAKTHLNVAVHPDNYERVAESAREILSSLTPTAKVGVFSGMTGCFYRLDI